VWFVCLLDCCGGLCWGVWFVVLGAVCIFGIGSFFSFDFFVGCCVG